MCRFVTVSISCEGFVPVGLLWVSCILPLVLARCNFSWTIIQVHSTFQAHIPTSINVNKNRWDPLQRQGYHSITVRETNIACIRTEMNYWGKVSFWGWQTFTFREVWKFSFKNGTILAQWVCCLGFGLTVLNSSATNIAMVFIKTTVYLCLLW